MNYQMITTQNDLLLTNLKEFYQNTENLDKMICIINGQSKISLRIVDWFAKNYAKKYYTTYEIKNPGTPDVERFKVYNHYKLTSKAYSIQKFDAFCRGPRITIPYHEDSHIETTIGQLNFFKWAIENQVIEYTEAHRDEIEQDMIARNSSSKRRASSDTSTDTVSNAKTRKRREELSVYACKCIKKETIKVIVRF
jgi:hypothetical protein